MLCVRLDLGIDEARSSGSGARSNGERKVLL